jgi:hypothetical protein
LADTDYGKDGQRLSILPGTQDSVIVASNGLTIYDNGVARAMAAATDGLLTSTTNSPSLVYGFNNNNTGYDFVTLCINQYGIFAQASKQNLLSGFGTNLLFDAGILYGSNAAYDIGKQALIGSYTVADAVAIDPANRHIFTLRHFGTTQFVAYDMDTFAAIGNDPAFPTIHTDHTQLVRWADMGSPSPTAPTSSGSQACASASQSSCPDQVGGPFRAREWLSRSPSRPRHPGWLRCSVKSGSASASLMTKGRSSDSFVHL